MWAVIIVALITSASGIAEAQKRVKKVNLDPRPSAARGLELGTSLAGVHLITCHFHQWHFFAVAAAYIVISDT